jgi:hypothetical protein
VLQLTKKVSQNRTKLQQTKQNKRPFYLPKINKKGKIRFGQFLFENDPLDELKKMPSSKKLNIFSKLVKNGDHTGGFSTVFENCFRSRLVFVGLFDLRCRT